MPKLGLGTKSTNSGLITPGIVTDSLVLKHNYNAGRVVPVSDGAAYFDGTNDYIEIADSASLDFNDGDFTLACWAKIPTGADSEKLMDKWLAHSGEGGWFLFISNGNLRVRMEDGSGTNNATDDGAGDYIVFSGSTSIDTNNWVHLAVTYDSDGDITLYVNGVVDGTNSNASALGAIDTSYPLRFGINQSSNEDFNGYMCNAAIWTTALTQPQIKSIMNKNYAGLTDSEKTNLVSWWNLDNVSFPTANTNYFSGKTGALHYTDGVTGSGLPSNTSVVDFVTTNGDELGDDIFGGKGTFDDDSYWGTNTSTISNGVFLSSKAGYNALNKASILEDGKIYKLSFDILEFTSKGNLQLKFNWNQSSGTDAYPNIWKAEDGTGSFYIYFKPGSGTRSTFTIYVSDTDTDAGGPDTSYGELTLDNVVVQEVKNAGELI